MSEPSERPERPEPPEWDGPVLRGSVADWDSEHPVIPKLPGSDLFDQGEWSIECSVSLREFEEVLINHGPNQANDLTLTFTLKARPEVRGLADTTVGPFRIPVKAHRGVVKFNPPDDMVWFHNRAKSRFEMHVSCPSRELVPPEPAEVEWTAEGGSNPSLTGDYLSSKCAQTCCTEGRS